MNEHRETGSLRNKPERNATAASAENIMFFWWESGLVMCSADGIQRMEEIIEKRSQSTDSGAVGEGRWMDGDRYEEFQTVIWCLCSTGMLLLSYLCRDYLMDWQRPPPPSSHPLTSLNLHVVLRERQTNGFTPVAVTEKISVRKCSFNLNCEHLCQGLILARILLNIEWVHRFKYSYCIFYINDISLTGAEPWEEDLFGSVCICLIDSSFRIPDSLA